MVVSPHPALGGAAFFFHARVLALDSDDEQLVGHEAMPSAYQRNFIVSLRMSDPRYFHTAVASTGPQSAGSTPSIVLAGTAPADPGFTVAGPISDDLVFERYGNPDARKLLFNDVTVPGGQSAFLNYTLRSLVRSDGTDLTGKLVMGASDWWDDGIWGLYPGSTMVRCAGGGSWTMACNPADW
jgi:hypothetical protein